LSGRGLFEEDYGAEDLLLKGFDRALVKKSTAVDVQVF